LLQQLLSRAEKAGVQKVFASVKRNNQAMLALARKFAFTLSVDVADPSVVLATKKLGK
jgi:L-amino acid N-acyltransferase YncA